MKRMLCGLLACTAATISVSGWADSSSREYNLELVRSSVRAALIEFSKQTGLQTAFYPDDPSAANIVVGPLSGHYTEEEALGKLLAASGLSFQLTNERMITVLATDAATSPRHGDRAELGSRSEAQAPPEFLRLVDRRMTSEDDERSLSHLTANEEDYKNPQSADIKESRRVSELEEIVVTGTHIRGVSPIGSALLVIDREEIERSGRGSIQDIFATVPQNFGGSASEIFQSDAKAANFTRGQAVDLRGLGASSTLVLINGRRQPAGGLEGAFVDISSIAASAVERIEILPDGASALYGSDAVGGVVNVILRKSYEGLETSLRVDSLEDSAEQYQLSLVGGESWGHGNAIGGYQYLRRDAVLAADTFYGAMGKDYRPIGGSDFRVFGGNPGTILDAAGRPAFAIPHGQDGAHLIVSELLPGRNYQDDLTGIAALPAQEQSSAFFSVSEDISDRLEIFAQGQYSKREMNIAGGDDGRVVSVPSTNPYYVNPFGTTGPVRVKYNFAKDLGGLTTQSSDSESYAFTAGGSIALSSQWRLNAAATYGRETDRWSFFNTALAAAITTCISGVASGGCPGAPLNVFGDGAANDPTTIDFIRVAQAGQGISTNSSVTAIADGPLFTWPAGTVKLAIGVDYRDEDLDAERTTVRPYTGSVTRSSSLTVGALSREVSALFAELAVPIMAARDQAQERTLLELSVAGRYEDYTDFGTTLNPKVGMNFMPLKGLTLRASWGTSFRAPRFNEISASSNPAEAFIFPAIPDPRSPTGTSDVIYLGGADPNLKPETANIWTAGFDINPAWVNGLSVSAEFFNIDYKNKIQVGGSGFTTLLLENQWTEIITRNPSAAQIAAVCARPEFLDECPISIAAIVDGSLRNLGGVRTHGIDLNLMYRKSLPAGDLRFGVGGVYTLAYERALSSTAPFIDVLDTVANTPSLRLRGVSSWDFNQWSANAYINFTGSYNDTANNTIVESWTTVDLGLSYRVVEGWLGKVRFSLSALNLFDKEPPFVNQIGGFDAANATPLGRSVSLRVSKEW